MRIDQFVPHLVQHDAIGNHVLQVRRALRAAGYESDIYAYATDDRTSREARPYTECDPRPDPHRLLLYHASIDSPIAAWLEATAEDGQLLASDYHNVTPSRYFARWEPMVARGIELARQELSRLAPLTALAVADSAYNEAELIEMGYPNTAVCPLLIDLEDLHRAPDATVMARLQRRQAEGGAHWLFVGRLAPNKCQHDVIAAFAVYRRLFDPAARLTLIGAASSLRYRRALEQMVQELDLGDRVEIRGSVSFGELLAHLRGTDVFVCLSEHEGFCVPIIESMELGLPVVAFRAAAVTDTVGNGGVLLDDKDPLVVACAVDELLADPVRREAIVTAGRARAAAFSLDTTSRHFVATVSAWLSGGPVARLGRQ